MTTSTRFYYLLEAINFLDDGLDGKRSLGKWRAAALPPQSTCIDRRRRFAAAVDVLCYVLHFLWRPPAKHRLLGRE